MLNFVHFIKHIRRTGAIAPSSSFLVREMIQGMLALKSNAQQPLRILELGPGTGVITKAIIAHMSPDDHLDVVELDPKFYQHIESNYARKNVKVYGMNVLDFNPGIAYDVIISSIPYDQIPGDITTTLWKKKMALSRPGTVLSYFKYYKFRFIRNRFEREVNRKYRTSEKLVFRNIPPALVYTLRF